MSFVFLVLVLLCGLATAQYIRPSSNWVFFEIYSGDSCSSERVYLHGLLAGACQQDEQFLALWDGGRVVDNTQSYRLVALSPWSRLSDFSLERYNDSLCSPAALQDTVYVPTAPLNEPVTASAGNWTVNGCGTSPFDDRHALALRATRGPFAPTLESESKLFTQLSFIDAYDPVSCDSLLVPTNYTVYLPGHCFSRDNDTSMMFLCPPLTPFYATTPSKILYFDDPQCGLNASLDVPFNGYCGAEQLPQYLDMDLSTRDEPWTPGLALTASPIAFPLYNVTTIHRQGCMDPLSTNNLWTPPTMLPTLSISPTASPTGRLYSPVRLFFSFSISPVYEPSVVNDSAITAEIQRLVCGAVDGVSASYCEEMQQSTREMPRESVENTTRYSPTNYELLVSVNVSLNPVDFLFLQNNATAIESYAAAKLMNISSSDAWLYFFDNVVHLHIGVFHWTDTAIHHAVVSRSASLSSTSPAPPDDVVTPTATPSLRPQSGSDSHRRGELKSSQVIWISVCVGFVVLLWGLVYIYCITKKNVRCTASCGCGSDNVLPME